MKAKDGTCIDLWKEAVRFWRILALVRHWDGYGLLFVLPSSFCTGQPPLARADKPWRCWHTQDSCNSIR
eukprot:471322-Amphidinium_carterae.1